jgi:hypothetical protein
LEFPTNFSNTFAKIWKLLGAKCCLPGLVKQEYARHGLWPIWPGAME